jgi:(p)ppGpp synthase/HD superfamily hydrolase
MNDAAMPSTLEPAMTLPAVAATNIALYRQLYAAGWDAAQLTAIRDGYEFAKMLFAGRYRASGKPFVAHLVGTASVLAAHGADRDTVAAGLLHAAYESGDFGLARWRTRRARVARAIGAAAEALVWRYQELGWADATVARMHDGVAALAPADRTILLMRLANELDDNLDLEMRFCHPSRDRHRQHGDMILAMARALEQPALAQALAEAYREADAGSWAASLSLNRAASYQLASPFGLRLSRLAHGIIDAVWR